MKRFSKKFTIESLVYCLDIAEDGRITFNVIAGQTERNSFEPDWSDDFVEFGMRDRVYFSNARKVFRALENIILEHINIEKPYILYFTSNTAKKQKVYRKLANRFIKQLPEYIMYEYADIFYFVHKAG